jgi:hypothetical protein
VSTGVVLAVYGTAESEWSERVDVLWVGMDAGRLDAFGEEMW